MVNSIKRIDNNITLGKDKIIKAAWKAASRNIDN